MHTTKRTAKLTKKKSVHNLQPNQAKQAIGLDGVRSLEAQRAWLEEEKMRADMKIPNAVPDYEIKNGKLIVYRPCTISDREMKQLIARM